MFVGAGQAAAQAAGADHPDALWFGWICSTQPARDRSLFGVTKQRISQLEIAALVWLRQPAHSQELRSLLARHDQAQYELRIDWRKSGCDAGRAKWTPLNELPSRPGQKSSFRQPVWPVEPVEAAALALADSAGTPASPKKRYRSEYVYPWRAALADPDQVLPGKACPTLTWPCGWSILVACAGSGTTAGLEVRPSWSLSTRSPFSIDCLANREPLEPSRCLQNLADPRYADHAVWFGFHNGSIHRRGVRYFLTALGRHSDAEHASVSVEQGQEIVQVEIQKLNLLLVGALGVMRQVPVLSPQSLAGSFALPGWPDP